MEFFKQLSEIMGEGSTLAITIAKKADTLSVSVLPGNNLVKDAAKSKIIPLCINGTVQEMDDGFIEAIKQPIKKSIDFLSNVSEYEKAQEEAKNASEMEKKAKEEAAKIKTDFNGWLSLAETNFKEKKFKDANTCLDSAEKIAANIGGGMAKVDTLRKKIKEALGEGSMFGAEVEDKSDGKNIKLSAGKAKPTAKAETNDDGE